VCVCVCVCVFGVLCFPLLPIFSFSVVSVLYMAFVFGLAAPYAVGTRLWTRNQRIRATIITGGWKLVEP
jgi:hypothetical protein